MTMKTKFFIHSPLALAVAGLLFSPVALADDKKEKEVVPTAHLGTLQVTTDRQGAKIKTNVVTTALKDESTATDLRGLFKAEPSVDFSGGNGASQFWTIRGMGQNSIDVKVDNAYSDSQILYHQGRFTLDPALVRIVAVQKGAGSASAGIGATNGAIVARTVDAQTLLKGSDKDWGFKINAGFSTNKEQGFGLTGFGKSDKFDFLIATNRIDQQNYKAGKGYVGYFGGSVVPFSASDKESHLYKMGYNLNDNHRFVLSYYKDMNKGVRSIREEFDVRPANEIGGRLTEERQEPQYRELSLTNTNLEWTGKNLGFADEATANFYVMKNTRFSGNDAGCGYCGGNRNNQNAALIKIDNPSSTTSVITKGANVNFDSQLNANTLLKYGLNYRNQEIEPNAKSANFVKNTEKTDTGVYAEGIYDIGQFTLTGGLRYDRFDYTAVTGKSASNGRLSPSVGVIFQATPTLSFNASHNHATRSPRLVDALMSGGRASSTTIADGVKAERAKNSEIGFNYNDGALTVSGGVFHQKIDGLLNSGRIVHAGQDQQGVTATGIDNVGYGKNKGWELNAGYKYQNLTTRLGVAESSPEFYTYAGKTTNGTNPISFTNREYGNKMGRIWTAGLAYRFAQPNLEIGLNHRLAQKVKGQAWMSDPNALNFESVRDGYNTTDIYGNWKPYGNDKMNVNFALNNVGNKYYRPHSSQGLPAVGREFKVGVNFTY